MSLVKFVQGKEDNLPSIAETGAIYFTTDECIYLGLADGTYKVYGNFITVNTVDDLPETSNEFVLFYIKEENALYKYDNENLVWSQVTVDTSTTYDIVNGETKGSIVVTATNSDGEIVSQETIQIVDVEALETKINSATYDDTQIKADIKTNSDAIVIIVADYLKNADKQELINAIATAKSEAVATVLGEGVDVKYDTLLEVANWILSDETKSAELIAKVNTIESDYLTSTDKTELKNDISDLDNRFQETENTITNLGTLATMDEITEDVIPDSLIQKINESDANSHTHNNQPELDKIQVGDVGKWNSIESNVKAYVDESISNVDVSDKLSDYYKKTETYSQSEVDALVSVISTYDTEVVTSLPTENIGETTIYLLVTDNGDGTSTVTSYVYDNNTWVIMTEQKQDIGDMSIHWGTF